MRHPAYGMFDGILMPPFARRNGNPVPVDPALGNASAAAGPSASSTGANSGPSGSSFPGSGRTLGQSPNASPNPKRVRSSSPSAAPSSAAQPSSTTGLPNGITEEAVQSLVGLGATRAQAISLLEAAGGNAEVAASLLFSG